jgi:hypothetical protein
MSHPVVYWVDARDQLVRVNEAWDVFANENDAPDLVADRVVGRPIWACIADAGTRHLYAGLLPRVRAGATARFSLRCDSPTMRRRLHLTVSPGQEGLVQFESVVTAIEHRPEQALLRRDLTRGLGLLTVCGWCKRVSVLDGWVELEEAIAQLRLFDAELPPELSHGICPTCGRRLMATLEEARRPEDDGRRG